jgi:hypothetical protein
LNKFACLWQAVIENNRNKNRLIVGTAVFIFKPSTLKLLNIKK